MEKVPAVLLVDRFRLARALTKMVLAEEPSIKMVAEAANLEEAMQCVRESKINVILAIAYPEYQDCFELLEFAKRNKPAIRFLLLSVAPEPEQWKRAKMLGADAYLTKAVTKHKLIKVIKHVLDGKTFINHPPEEFSQDVSTLKSEIPPLSPREKEVLSLILDGMNNNDIASKLFISTRTVENHRSSIMRKVGSKNTAELVKVVMDKKIL